MSSLDEISLAIGSLQAKVENLPAVVTGVASLHLAVADLKSDVEVLSKDVAAIKPVADKVNRWEQRVLGVAAFFSLIGGLFSTEVIGRIRGWWS